MTGGRGILFITSTHIGDAVLSTGLLDRLLTDYPAEPVTIACGAPAAKVFAAAPRVERIHVLRKQRFAGHWFGFWRSAIGRRWRVLVDLRRSGSPYVLRAAAKHVLPKTGVPMHRVELIAKTMGLAPQAPRVWTDDSHEARARALLGDGGVVAMAPGATWAGKIWPAANFVALVEQLLGAGGPYGDCRLLLVGAESERDAAAPLAAALPAERMIDGMGVDVLSTYAALRRCRLFVGNDSAMMHLAAASGQPTVGLFGPTRDVHYAPWGDNGLVVRTPESVEALIGHPGYDTRTTGSMMGTLSAETVAAAIRERWGANRKQPA